MESASPAPGLDDSPAAALYRQHGPLIFAWLLVSRPALGRAKLIP